MPDTYDPFMPMQLDDPKKTPPGVSYRKDAFDEDNWVFFDIVRKIPNERCYFCHSNFDVGKSSSEKWAADEDVHLAAGLTALRIHQGTHPSLGPFAMTRKWKRQVGKNFLGLAQHSAQNVDTIPKPA